MIIQMDFLNLYQICPHILLHKLFHSQGEGDIRNPLSFLNEIQLELITF